MSTTAGVPLHEGMIANSTITSSWSNGVKNDYLPNAYTLGDILGDAGYDQEFIIGSDGYYSGRTQWFENHGNYRVVDYTYELKKGRLPEDYCVWWGHEDKKLYEFAREDILQLAESKRPFNLTMLTVDTHFPGGYYCNLCEDKYNEQYSNVYACASKQVQEFIDWVQKQDFYENTTIVISGDHPTMDSEYIEEMKLGEYYGYDRLTYTAIINPDDKCRIDNDGRIFTTMDLYPTTVAALGGVIEGNRIGLGVNLFSDEETLIEKYGIDYVCGEIEKKSYFYEYYLIGENGER